MTVTTETTSDGPASAAAVQASAEIAAAEAAAPSAPRSMPKKMSLGGAYRFFFTKATPKIIIPALAVCVVLRVWVGGLGWRDLAMVVGILALEPFTEWAIHVHLLHQKPWTWGGRRFDLHAARKHREHHMNPNDPDTAFVPIPDLIFLAPIMMGIMWLVSWSVPVFLTGLVTGFAMLLVYEWTHFLIHTPYRPKGRYYRYIWRAHRLHHFRNEHYWFGVTVHLADHVLHTFPAKSEVSNSPTARTLGVEVDA